LVDRALRLATAPSERSVVGMRICIIGGTGHISTSLVTYCPAGPRGHLFQSRAQWNVPEGAG
jgi:hypothetical protein